MQIVQSLNEGRTHLLALLNDYFTIQLINMQTIPHRPLFLGFSSQKGGVGKSTLAEILSSILYYEEGISLFVVDCDLTQDSFFKLREREKETIGEDASLTAYMQRYFQGINRKSYRIIKASPAEAIQKAEALIAKYPDEAYQLVIFDFPGHAGTRELLELSLEMDYILSPIEPDIQSMVACLTYAKSIQDLGVSMQTARIKDIMLLWNKVDRRVKNTLITHYSQHIEEEGLTLLPFHPYTAHRFSHELSMYGARGVFRSTYLPPVKALRAGTNIDELKDWLIRKLNLSKTPDHAHD